MGRLLHQADEGAAEPRTLPARSGHDVCLVHLPLDGWAGRGDGVLHRLQEAVELVNQAATASVRAEQEQGKVKQHPAAKAEGNTAASLAAGLFARLSRR